MIGPAMTVMGRVFGGEVAPALSVTVQLGLYGPAVVGLPVMAPVIGLTVIPGGNPLQLQPTYVPEPPLAVSCPE